MGIVLAIAAVAAARGFAQHASAPEPSPPEPAVPVLTTTAARGNVPVYLEGIGTVQADNAVLVRSRVDGTLMQVPVREGQEVKQGDVIAVIAIGCSTGWRRIGMRACLDWRRSSAKSAPAEPVGPFPHPRCADRSSVLPRLVA